jgi:hypothetical protein
MENNKIVLGILAEEKYKTFYDDLKKMDNVDLGEEHEDCQERLNQMQYKTSIEHLIPDREAFLEINIKMFLIQLEAFDRAAQLCQERGYSNVN